jgi:hypothetical protein
VADLALAWCAALRTAAPALPARAGQVLYANAALRAAKGLPPREEETAGAGTASIKADDSAHSKKQVLGRCACAFV